MEFKLACTHIFFQGFSGLPQKKRSGDSRVRKSPRFCIFLFFFASSTEISSASAIVIAVATVAVTSAVTVATHHVDGCRHEVGGYHVPVVCNLPALATELCVVNVACRFSYLLQSVLPQLLRRVSGNLRLS